MAGSTNKHNGKVAPRGRSLEDKIRVVFEAAKLPDEELGAYLRREGVHEAQLAEWRETVIDGASRELSGRKRNDTERAHARRIRELEREVSRKDKALAEVTALLALQEKLETLWGDEDGDTTPRSGRAS